MRRKISLWGIALVTTMWFGFGVTSLAQGLRTPLNSGRRIISGQDVGFRVEGRDPRTGRPTGTRVVRVDGEWTPVGTMPSVVPAK
jgi:hypothetical protein